MLQLRDMMTAQVRTLREDDTLTSADWDMVVAEVHHLPVVDRFNRVVGMISDREVLRAGSLAGVSVGHVMNREFATALASTPAVDAAVQLLQSHQTALPVVDANGTLLGIVTTTDFVELAHRALAGLDVQRPHARA